MSAHHVSPFHPVELVDLSQNTQLNKTVSLEPWKCFIYFPNLSQSPCGSVELVESKLDVNWMRYHPDVHCWLSGWDYIGSYSRCSFHCVCTVPWMNKEETFRPFLTKIYFKTLMKLLIMMCTLHVIREIFFFFLIVTPHDILIVIKSKPSLKFVYGVTFFKTKWYRFKLFNSA